MAKATRRHAVIAAALAVLVAVAHCEPACFGYKGSCVTSPQFILSLSGSDNAVDM